MKDLIQIETLRLETELNSLKDEQLNLDINELEQQLNILLLSRS